MSGLASVAPCDEMAKTCWENCNRDDQAADDVAAHLRCQLEREQQEKARKKKERLEAHLYTVVRLATHNELVAEIGKDRFFDLVTHEKVPTLRIKKELTLLHLKQEIWRLTGARPSQQRLWLWAKRQNHTFRPDRPLQLEYDEHVPMMDVKEDHPPPAGKFQAEIRLYLEHAKPQMRAMILLAINCLKKKLKI